jgi:hypothetical protein
MILKNPFADYGGIVIDNRFVGRKKEIEAIQNRLLGSSYGNLSVVGLPRVGKSSLVWNAIFLDKEKLIGKKIIPIWISFGEYDSIYEMLDEIIFEIGEFFFESNLASELQEIANKIIISNSQVEKRRFIKRYFKYVKQKEYRIIITLDEFDNSQNILSLQDFQFLRELSYSVETKIGLITISRKSIQELEPDNGALSNFYQIFTDLRLKLFSDFDKDLYWKRIENLGFNVSADYKTLSDEYCGSHPYLLDVLNHDVFNQISQTEIDLKDTFLEIIDDLRLKLYNEFEAILKLMTFEGLGDKLMQMVVGPVYNIDQRDTEKLLKYAIVYKNITENYSSFSKFFNDYLLLKSSAIDVWPLWSEVERELRNLIKKELFETFGDNWEIGYRKCFGKEVESINGEKYRKVEVLDGGPNSLGLTKEKERSKYLFGDLASVHLIDYTLPRNMFESFISKNWPWYAKTLGKDKTYWSPIFEHLGKIRNPLAHNNPNFLSDSDKNLAEGYCKMLLEKIKQWKERELD